jgi:hypothetical protein
VSESLATATNPNVQKQANDAHSGILKAAANRGAPKNHPIF